MNIEEAQSRKRRLEFEIKTLLHKFKSDTGLNVDKIYVMYAQIGKVDSVRGMINDVSVAVYI